MTFPLGQSSLIIPVVKTASESELSWYDVKEWGVEGRAWEDHERLRYFDRMPADAEEEMKGIVDGMGLESAWNMSRCSAGMMARFRTNASAIHVRYRLLNDKLAMPHMPATGVSGVDLYARNESGEWRFVNGISPFPRNVEDPSLDSRNVENVIATGILAGSREYALNFPLYNGVESMEIGVPAGAAFAGLAPRVKPIVFYGTSITQGGVASRPGICHTALLGRRLDRPVLNLGFSGTGRMNPVVVRYLAEVDAAVFVIECSANMNPAQIRERCIPLVKALRVARPDTPILLVEDRGLPNGWIIPVGAENLSQNHLALRECFEALQQEQVPAVHYLRGADLYGGDGEGSTDNVHANDLGFLRMADVMEPVLRDILGTK